jgi:hypothetical protein
MESPRGLDGYLAGIASEIPGFGGMFYDEAGNLNVYMVHEDGVPRLNRLQLASRLGTQLQAMGVAGAAAQRLLVREGAYDFAQLAAWHLRLLPVLSLQGVVFTDADETRNRLRIGIQEGVSPVHVEHALQQLDIPRQAVVFEVSHEISPFAGHTLRDRVRPVAGGLQITFQRPEEPDVSYLCTLGFNVRPGPELQLPRGAPTDFFATSSSGCSREMGSGLAALTEYWQPLPSVENSFIGWEIYDPEFHSAGGHCFWPRCRWSNMIGGGYAAGVGVEFGHLYRTLFPGTVVDDTPEPGSLEIDPADSRFRIVAEAPYPLAGQTLHKVGRGTGWTAGPVFDTCINVSVGGQPVLTVLPCQDRFTSAWGAGDTGSPVFRRLGADTDDRVVLHGLAWGATSTAAGPGLPPLPRVVFSSMEMIRFDFPGAWITH